MKTDLKQFEGPYSEQFKRLAENWEGSHVKIIGITHPWFGEVGHVKCIERLAGKTAMIVELDNSVECAVFSGKDLKKI